MARRKQHPPPVEPFNRLLAYLGRAASAAWELSQNAWLRPHQVVRARFHDLFVRLRGIQAEASAMSETVIAASQRRQS